MALELARVKEFLRVEHAREDALLTGFVASAAALCEAFTGRVLIERACRETVAADGEWRRLMATPFKSVTAVSGLPPDGAAAVALAPSAYEVMIDASGDGWVRGRLTGINRLRVSFVAGMAVEAGELPAPLTQGMLRLVAYLYAHRDAATDKGPPSAVAALWRPWRRVRVA